MHGPTNGFQKFEAIYIGLIFFFLSLKYLKIRIELGVQHKLVGVNLSPNKHPELKKLQGCIKLDLFTLAAGLTRWSASCTDVILMTINDQVCMQSPPISLMVMQVLLKYSV